MKVGDKFICKKNLDLIYQNTTHGGWHFIRGVEYTIYDQSSIGGNDHAYLMANDEVRLWFVSTPDNEYYVWDYFYSPQELRNLKLKKLDESRR